ncbi:hypothetical protein DNX69_25245 [Rhodopseudomonas palustris]|uniref:Class I SAM-dependent methyltransferase n=2 Tax=Rhodopseudomonas palustris TaxID=1076 RepID=A0A323U9C1_RHOPL|nr:hypothetical protein DNX69_25245 [Rhodopseudomonas palustris]
MTRRRCWCSGEIEIEFSSEYVRCGVCGTLVSIAGLPDDTYQASDDESKFYGKDYWIGHQGGDLSLPNIFQRSKTDLLDRNLYWLRTLLRYKLPPADVLELGCSHGSFVALLRQAGYQASGTEMSRWVVEYAAKTFDVPVVHGTVDAASAAGTKFDVVVLMDVLEHLPSPVDTMRRALDLLKPEGFILLQTPAFPSAETIEDIQKAHPDFVRMLIPEEHLYLFTKSSATKLFRDLGAHHMIFENPIFPQHDMFFLVGRQPITPLPEAEVAEALATPKGRFVQALLDQESHIKRLEAEIVTINADREARLAQIHALTKMVHESQSATDALIEQVKSMSNTTTERRQ